MLICGKHFEWKKADELREGDEVIFGTTWSAPRDYIVNLYNETPNRPDGIWVDWLYGDCGYLRKESRYRVLL